MTHWLSFILYFCFLFLFFVFKEKNFLFLPQNFKSTIYLALSLHFCFWISSLAISITFFIFFYYFCLLIQCVLLSTEMAICILIITGSIHMQLYLVWFMVRSLKRCHTHQLLLLAREKGRWKRQKKTWVFWEIKNNHWSIHRRLKENVCCVHSD